MKDFSYEKTFELCEAYAKLGERKQSIISFLFKRSYFEGNFTDLTKAMNRPKNHAMDIRKECILLAKMGLVYIVYEEENYNEYGDLIKKRNRPKAIFLIDGWMDFLIQWYRTETPNEWYLTKKEGQKRSSPFTD